MGIDLMGERMLQNTRPDEVTVVPLSFFTRAEVDFTTGGQFLRRLEWFLCHYYAGKVVMASTAKGVDYPDCGCLLHCPLGKWMKSPPLVSAYSERIISQHKATKITFGHRSEEGSADD